MTDEIITAPAIFSKTYLNPVYPRSFPDPFVLKFRGEYFAYCTDFWRDGKVFGVLRSRDLVNWTEVGGAMQKLDNDAPFYWAPEVTYHNGKFYLYYSVGNETLMEIRVAVSDSPESGFIDAGVKLTNEDFAIDAHVFTDDDGERYLFYATDFLEHTHIGTGTVVDKMLDFFTLEGRPRAVTRAKYDWQIYDPQRKEKGGVRWHTVEGSFVLKRKGVYYEMFSGGNWQNITYGVSFAVTGDIRRDEEWLQFADGEKIYPILRTVPNLIVGPGHNSVVRGVDNRELYCVYHRWTEQGRALAIDRMDFAGGERMFIQGATYTPQSAPHLPHVSDFFDEFSHENWETISGEWRVENNQLISSAASGKCELLCRAARAENFLCETWLAAAADGESSGGAYGICLKNEAATEVFKFSLSPGSRQAAAVWSAENGSTQSRTFALPESFDFRAFHLLRIETDERWLRISLDENTISFEVSLEKTAPRLALIAENMQVAFSGFALTIGFEDLFENAAPEKRGWQKINSENDANGGGENIRVKNGNLTIVSRSGEKETVLWKEILHDYYEVAVNFRLDETYGEESSFGFYLMFADDKADFSIERAASGEWILKVGGAVETNQYVLPESFSPDVFQQIRFIKIDGRILLQLETQAIGMISSGIAAASTKIALFVKNSSVSFDMVRVTAL